MFSDNEQNLKKIMSELNFLHQSTGLPVKTLRGKIRQVP